MSPFIEIKSISKSFKNHNGNIEVISDFSLSVMKGELFGIFGPNGSGKTTLMHLLSGLLSPDNGKILINGKEPNECNIGLVFQNYSQALLPWRTNLENIGFPLELKGHGKDEIKKQVEQLVDDLEINFDLNGYPYQLSGGQQQLLSIARALISNPDIMLFDEPLSSLDFQTSLFISEEIKKIWKKKGITTIFISHNIEDAIFMCSKITFITPRPASVYRTLDIDLGSNDNSIRTSEKFIGYRQKALEIFYSLKDEFKIS